MCLSENLKLYVYLVLEILKIFHTSQKFINARKQILLCAMLGIDVSALRTRQGARPPLTDEDDMHQPGHQPWAPTLHKGCLVGLGSQAPNSTGTDIYLGCLWVPKVQLQQPGMATSPLPESCSTKGLRGGWDFNSSTGKHWRRRGCQQAGWRYKRGPGKHTHNGGGMGTHPGMGNGGDIGQGWCASQSISAAITKYHRQELSRTEI